MNELDEIARDFIKLKVAEALAAEFRWGVTVGAIVGFILGAAAMLASQAR